MSTISTEANQSPRAPESSRGSTESRAVAARRVKEVLSGHILTKGMMPFVLDMQRSRGVDLFDQVTGRRYLDFFGFYASSVLGMNHPALTEDEDFNRRLHEAALNKVTNSDVATVHAARFVDTFGRVAIPKYLPYAFFISGGALAVENALKAAFDWKVRKNLAKGYDREVGEKGTARRVRRRHGRAARRAATHGQQRAGPTPGMASR